MRRSQQRFGAWVGVALASAVGGCGGGSSQSGGGGMSGMGGMAGIPAGGTPPACAWGAADPVARALCQTPPPPLGGLTDLYRRLDLETFFEQRLTAATTHSLGLSARIVSGTNPRVFVYSSFANPSLDGHGLDPSHIAAAAFARGEQMVELAAYDPIAGDFNFYLLRFEQACNQTGCTSVDLLTERIENGWTRWTLEADRDLEDTPLDCLSCHRPEGPNGRKRLLMRQFENPWLHWSDFEGFRQAGNCDPTKLPPDAGPPGDIAILGERLRGLDQIGAAAPGAYAGVPMEELSLAASGHDLSSFILIAAAVLADKPLREGTEIWGEPHPFDSLQILCEHSVGRLDTWLRYRAAMLDRGFPTPHHLPDVLDPARRAEAVADYPAFLARNAGTDVFELAAGLMGAEAAEASGFRPAESDDAPTILRRMCIRCHDSATDPRLRRARFDAEKVDQLTPDGAAAIWARLTAPRSSPELMPPLRAGELTPSAMAKIEAFLFAR